MFLFWMTGVEKVAIVGAAGAIGNAVAAELDRRGTSYRVIGRHRGKLEELFAGKAEMVEADIGKTGDAQRALAGVDAAVYCVGLPYPQHALHPVLMRTTVDAALSTGLKRMALVSSVYGYGAPRAGRVSEDHPREPQTRKGRFRKEQEDIALSADGTGSLRTLILRLPDFYGPHAELSLADQVFRGALDGKAANWIGPADLPHEFVFVPDVGPVLADLMAREDSFGQAWNLGGAGTITGREFIAQAYRAAGHEPKFRAIGLLMLRLGGLFSPLLRELVEMNYLATTPLILDDGKLQRHLGSVRKTPYGEGIRRTVEWYRSKAPAA
jgi:nucleoside-diphosphate-sugar epimerase